MELYQFLIFPSPWIGAPVIRIRPSAKSGFISIINRRCARPGHLEYNCLPENSFIHALIRCFRSHRMGTAYLSVCSCQESGMVMVGQLVHGNFKRRALKSRHMMIHGSHKCIRIAKQIAAEFITVFFHACQKPSNRFHKCIIVHNRIPLVSFQPWFWVAIMLCKHDCIWICFFYRIPEHFPELVIVFFRMSQICRYIQPPAIYVIWRRYPFLCNIQNVFDQFWRIFVI